MRSTAPIYDCEQLFLIQSKSFEVENKAPLMQIEPTTPRLHAGCSERWAKGMWHHTLQEQLFWMFETPIADGLAWPFLITSLPPGSVDCNRSVQMSLMGLLMGHKRCVEINYLLNWILPAYTWQLILCTMWQYVTCLTQNKYIFKCVLSFLDVNANDE